MKLSPLVTLLLSLSSAAGIEQGTPLDRLVTQAQAQAKWTDATTPPEKLNLVREAALKLDIVSAPVSDRYLITALGGPIDLVHFLGLAITVSSGAMARDDALFDQWKREGGADFEAGLSTTYPTEAHPDDLPSNALGALFGEEIRTRQKDPNFDVAAAFREFFVPLEPVPDRIADRAREGLDRADDGGSRDRRLRAHRAGGRSCPRSALASFREARRCPSADDAAAQSLTLGPRQRSVYHVARYFPRSD